MPNRTLNRDDVYNFLLPYKARVYDPFELLAEIRTEMQSWVDDGATYKCKMTFKLHEVVDEEEKVYGINEKMMEAVGSWRSPMSGKNWWVNPMNPAAQKYSDINAECDNCGAVFGGTKYKNKHTDDCSQSDDEQVKSDLRDERLSWLNRAAWYRLDIDTATKRLGFKKQTTLDMIWEEDDFSYADRKEEGTRALATTWHIAREWGTPKETLAEAFGYPPSTVHSYITRYSQVEDEVPEDPTTKRY